MEQRQFVGGKVQTRIRDHMMRQTLAQRSKDAAFTGNQDGCLHNVAARFQRASEGGFQPRGSSSSVLAVQADLDYKHSTMQPARTMAGSSRLVSGFHFRGKLPHLKREGALYFVTFRLADSLPRECVLKLKREREALVQAALAAKRPLTWQEEQQLFAWYSERVEAFLDSGVGACWLRRPEIADLVAGALNFFNGERYDLHA